MVNVDENLKTIYKNDMFPLATRIAPKELELSFSELNLDVGIDQFAVDKGDFELHESICMEEQLKFGKCNASSVKFTLADVTDDIKGKEFSITQTVIADDETSYTMPLGYFTVDAAKKEDDLRFKDIIAYDRMRKIDTDVTSWYNGLFPNGNETYTLAAFRTSLLAFVGLTEDTSKLPLPNDMLTVKKTISPSQLSGRTVIEACEEINGCFGLIGRDGKFTHIIIKPMHHDYPQNDYPESDYPEAEPYDEYVDNYQGIHFEEYRVQPIDKLQIRQEENDVGCVYGTGSNVYIIQGNFLVYGKSAEELQTIAANASQNIFDRGYRPYTATGQGLPYIIPGDFIKYNADDTTAGYVFERTLKGLQALQDEYGAQGSEEQVQGFGMADDIIQIKGRSAKIEKSVDAVKITVSDMDTRLSGEIDVLAGQIVLKIDNNGHIGYIQLDGDPNTGLNSITIKADQISIEGLVTVNGRFKVLPDGSIEAVNGKFSGDITGANITGSTLETILGNKRTFIAGGEITSNYISLEEEGGNKHIGMQPDQINLIGPSSNTIIRPDQIATPLINGGTPITTANMYNFTYPTSIDLSNYVTANAYNFGMAIVGQQLNNLESRVSALEG